MAQRKHKPRIFKKIEKSFESGGHQRRGRKVAYADFMTAMMAFFLLMWSSLEPDGTKSCGGSADNFTQPRPLPRR